MARYAAPDRNGCSSPVAVRPPSGNTKSGIPLAQRLHRPAQARERGVRILNINRHLPRSPQIPADQRPPPQIFLRQDAELKGQRGKNHGRVHVGGVVRRIDGDGVLAKFSSPSTFNLDSEIRTALRAHNRAMRCCARPFLSTNETTSAVVRKPPSPATTAGACSTFVRQR